MTQWYLSYDGQQAGPMNLEQARNKASANPNGYAWREGFPSWVPIADVADFRRPPPATPLPERAPPSTTPRPSRADEVDFVIHGHEMQFVEIELDPGESAVAEAGAMMYKDPAIKLETIFGDGSHGSPDSGFMGKLLSAGKRLLTGESLFMTVFTHAGQHGKARVAKGYLFLVVDVNRFIPEATFRQYMDTLIRDVRSCEPARGVERIYVPGEPEHLRKAERNFRLDRILEFQVEA